MSNKNSYFRAMLTYIALGFTLFTFSYNIIADYNKYTLMLAFGLGIFLLFYGAIGLILNFIKNIKETIKETSTIDWIPLVMALIVAILLTNSVFSTTPLEPTEDSSLANGGNKSLENMIDLSPLLSAIGTLTLASVIVIVELRRYFRKPKLSIDFQRRGNIYRYTHIYNAVRTARNSETGEVSQELIFDTSNETQAYKKLKELELDVVNEKGIPARRCEAKVKIWREGVLVPEEPIILVWSRRAPIFYPEPMEQIEPVIINANDTEELRFLRLVYWESEGNIDNIELLQTHSQRPYFFEQNINYRMEVTVFSENAQPVSELFELRWDGTFEIENCIKKLE